MIDAEVKVLRTGAGVLARPDVKTLRLVGPDRVRFLNGMVSNDVAALAPGQGVLAVKTSSKGRVEALVRVRAASDALLLDVTAAVAERTRATLEQFIIMDDCVISDVSAERDVVSIVGPEGAHVLAAAGFDGAAALAPHASTSIGDVTVVADPSLGVPGFELHAPAGQGEAIALRLVAAGASPVSLAALDVVRVEAGVPADGRELDDETFPMEARLEHAISFSKGCYIGQEVIARATNFGGVKHILVGLVVDGDALPEEGAPIFVEGSDVRAGELTSIVRSPTLGRTIALGFVRRTEEAVGTRLVVASASVGRVGATVAALPFV
ncbi:hypothetical protein L6R52_35625 [Myxococcota bacterium]|nr:hypothetical protein [Myxococcota bacterium]